RSLCAARGSIGSIRVTTFTSSTAPGGAPAGVAFEAGAVAHQREVAAFAAGFAFVAAGSCFRALAGGGCAGGRTLLAPSEGEGLLLLQLLGRREPLLGLGLERRGSRNLGARLARSKRGYLAGWR